MLSQNFLTLIKKFIVLLVKDSSKSSNVVYTNQWELVTFLFQGVWVIVLKGFQPLYSATSLSGANVISCVKAQHLRIL